MKQTMKIARQKVLFLCTGNSCRSQMAEAIGNAGTAKRADEFRDVDFDLVATVCDSGAEECTIWLGKGKHLHHSFTDPAATDNMDDFRKVRDDIEEVMTDLPK